MRLIVLRVLWCLLLVACPLASWILGLSHAHPGPPTPHYFHPPWAVSVIEHLDRLQIAASVIAFVSTLWIWRGSEWIVWDAQVTITGVSLFDITRP